jgi:hypothetical protein
MSELSRQAADTPAITAMGGSTSPDSMSKTETELLYPDFSAEPGFRQCPMLGDFTGVPAYFVSTFVATSFCSAPTSTVFSVRRPCSLPRANRTRAFGLWCRRLYPAVADVEVEQRRPLMFVPKAESATAMVELPVESSTIVPPCTARSRSGGVGRPPAARFNVSARLQ